MRPIRVLTLAAGLMLLAHGAGRAQTKYKIQPIVKLGDKAGDVLIKANGDLEVGTLNDNGEIIFVTENDAGGETLIQYADGKLTPIVVSGKDAPGGMWGSSNGVDSPVSMNQLGNVVFATDVEAGGEANVGTYLWDFKAQKVTAIAVKGMPAVNNLTFETGGGFTSTINNNNEIALVAAVKNAAGDTKNGVFFVGRDGKLLPVAIPDQDLPGGGKVLTAGFTSINDAGVVAFEAQRDTDDQNSAYVWEKGTITPLVVVGSDSPGGGKFARIAGVRVNNKNKNVLVDARVGDSDAADGLYLFADGKLTPVAVPGQDMPGGGKLQNILSRRYTISYANDAGQIAFLATLEDGSGAAYLVDADGKPSLILKSGMATDLGQVTKVGMVGTDPESSGIGLNNKGQVAVNIKIGDGPATMVLLTPAAQ